MKKGNGVITGGWAHILSTALFAATFFCGGYAWSATPYPYDTGLVRLHFGNLPEEAASAREEDKILTIYFWQEGCPYCDRLEKEILSDTEIKKLVQAGFYLIEVNIFGAKEITGFQGEMTTEKEFAASHDIQFTPTLIFFGSGGKELFRMIGAWDKPHFTAALTFVKDGHFKRTTFQEFTESVWPKIRGDKGKRGAPDPYSTGIVSERSDDIRKELEKAKNNGKLLMVYFWRGGSPYCGIFEKDVLSREKLRKAINKGYRLIELDVSGGSEVTWLDGEKSDGKTLSSRLGVEEVPTLFFIGGDGDVVFRMPGVWRQTTHLEAATYYVKDGLYKESSFQEFIRYVWFKPKDHQGEEE